MSEPTLEDILVRLDDLLKEVRRQGRAAVAAQASAEACFQAVRAFSEEREVEEEPADEEPRGACPPEVAIHWLRTLIPVADAIDRVAVQATAIAEARPRSPRILFRFFRPAQPDGSVPVCALAEGLSVLKEQLQAALSDLGVTIDRRTGTPVDPERHRVVEVRPPNAGEQPGTVVAIVRPGYALGPTVVREVEVVAATDGRKGQ
jgi:molecular chaperone GrpE